MKVMKEVLQNVVTKEAFERVQQLNESLKSKIEIFINQYKVPGKVTIVIFTLL